MSLVCHTIVSRYTPQQRDPSSDDAWQIESSVGDARRLHLRPAPSFIPPSLKYDEYGMPVTGPMEPPHADVHEHLPDVSAWYRNLTAQRRVHPDRRPMTAPPCSSSVPASSRPPLRSSSDVQIAPPNNDSALTERNWFTSQFAQTNATRSPEASPLVDLLTRNPPPLPSEPAFKPPVFLSIGPSNRGFTMLERSGWEEGEGLGSARIERDGTGELGAKKALKAAFREGSDVERHILAAKPSKLAKATHESKTEVIDLTLSDHEMDSVPDAIDLTVSDSDQEEEEAEEEAEGEAEDSTQANIPPAALTSHGITLLTPIATTLKADRLGIGLKSSRHPKSVKRKAVTHTPAAIAAHIRAANKAHKDRMRYGRGSRGFARIRRKETEERAGMLAYMNS